MPSERNIGMVSRPARMRTSPHIMTYFQDGRLVLENYITRATFHGSSDTLLLLAYFRRWRTIDQASRDLTNYTSASLLGSIRNLLDNGLLITADSEQAKLARKFSKTWLWPIPSRYYHFSTKLDEPFSTPDEIRRFYERNLKGKAQPSIYKDYPGSRKIPLLSGAGRDAPLFDTMRRRKTTRAFTGQPISLKQLSRIVYYTWGRISLYETQEFGSLLHKSSPSAGARHPIEVYAVVNNVEGIDRGIYHYSVRNHSLELLKEGDFRDKCVEFSAGQEWTRNASVFFIMTAVVSRTAWKYRIPRVYRAFLLDAGHLSQSFLLASTALGLGAFCIGIISDVTIEKELEIDGVSETALFAVGVGHAARKPP